MISQLLYLISLFIPFSLGLVLCKLAIARSLKIRLFDRSVAERLTALTFYFLIVTIGFRIGSTKDLLMHLEKLGIAAFSFAVSTILGTLLVLALLYLPIRGRMGDPRSKSKGASNGPTLLVVLKDPLILLVLLSAGILLGFFLSVPPHSGTERVINLLLYALLFFIGISFARTNIPFKRIVSRPDLLLLPFGTALGSLLGGFLGSMFLFRVLPLTWGKAMAVSAGFGWYSLSGVILTDLDGPFLGTVALLSNMLRETIALIFIPLVSRCPLPYIAIGMGGATSMDVTLPVIERSLGPESAPLAMVSGALLSAAVPLLVPLFYRLG